MNLNIHQKFLQKKNIFIKYFFCKKNKKITLVYYQTKYTHYHLSKATTLI